MSHEDQRKTLAIYIYIYIISANMSPNYEISRLGDLTVNRTISQVTVLI